MPDLAQAGQYFYDALAAQQRQDYAAMAHLLEQALAIVPDRVSVLTNLSVALLKLDRADEALAHAEKSVALDADNAEGWLNAGNAHRALKRYPDALACYSRALAINSAFAEAWMNRGNVHADLKQSEDALADYQRALTLNARNPELHNNLGNVLGTLKQYDQALASFGVAIALNPQYAEAYEHRADLWMVMGDTRAARQDYEQALRLDPLSPVCRLKHLIAGLPVIPATAADAEASRPQFAGEAAQLIEWIQAIAIDGGHKAVGQAQPFYIAYQEEDNRTLLEAYGAVCVALMRGLRDSLPATPLRRAEAPPSKIKLGIVSACIKNHSVWHALVKGWVKHLDKATFDLRVFHLSGDFDDETAFARDHVRVLHHGDKTLRQWVSLLSAEAPDVLIYPDLCMDSMAVRLASLRLAPVQNAAWGHPETTGLPTLDYYLSAADFEAEGSSRYYSEKLVALPALGCCYDELPVPDAPFDWSTLGIGAGRIRFVCPGTPYKYAPQHDGVFVQIARRVPDAAFVFFNHFEAPPLSTRLFERLSACFDKAGLDFSRYAVTVPWQTRPLFHGLMRQADVYLDTIGFSGFNTAMQAVACGLPIVTCEGRFMRGRFASAILKRMQLTECVTQDDAAYVDCAVRLALDGRYRDGLREKMASARHVLYGDTSSIVALQDFLTGLFRSSHAKNQTR